MKKNALLLSLLLIITSCSVKQTRMSLDSGDYDAAINKSVRKLQGDKNDKRKQDYVYMLEEAFAKAKERDLRNINTWFKDANPNNLEKIYNAYLQLSYRQELIRPLLPLKLLKQGRDAIFPFEDYTDQTVSSKNTLSKYLYDNSKALLITKDKLTIRRAYDDLMYLESINPGYKDVYTLIDEAKFKGTDFVLVSTKNETNIIIPKNLMENLLDFNTYGLSDKWTIFHSSKQKGIIYDFGLTLNFCQINITPEMVKEKQFEKEKQIKEGETVLLDANGKVVKDSSGKPVKVDKMKTVRVSIYEFSQLKSCQITAEVNYLDLKTNQRMDSFPLTSEFVFSNIYANYKGDKVACEETYYPTFDRKPIPFPSNEQMVYDTGTDLKNKLKNILSQTKLRG